MAKRYKYKQKHQELNQYYQTQDDISIYRTDYSCSDRSKQTLNLSR